MLTLARWSVPAVMPRKPEADPLSAKALKKRLVRAFAADDRTMRDLAANLDIHESRVSRWASPNNEVIPSERQLPAVVKVLGIDGHWLLTGEGDMKRVNPGIQRSAFLRIAKIIDAVREEGD